MSKADFLDAEPWDMRLGPLLWDYLTSVFKYPKSQELPMILTILFSQTTEKFNSIMQEIFGETKRSKEIAQKILTKAYNEIESDEFDELMAKKQTNTTIISDEYFLPEDL
jgi:hypothetical protein